MSRRAYWYEFHEMYCVLCSRTEVERVRVYDRPKPKAWHERHIITETACTSHFL
jgi:hypothetical protein